MMIENQLNAVQYNLLSIYWNSSRKVYLRMKKYNIYFAVRTNGIQLMLKIIQTRYKNNLKQMFYYVKELIFALFSDYIIILIKK